MSKVKFKLNKKGVGELLKSKEMQAILNQHANRTQAKAGPGYEINSFVGFDRAHAVIFAETNEAKKDNLENNTLLKSLGGGS